MASGPRTADLTEAETALCDLAADDKRDALSLSDKETLILRLYDQLQELELERALLEEELEEPVGDDVEDQLRVAEQELLEARASYTIRRRAIETVLMTDPVLKAVHLKATTPAERALLPLIHRRDVLSMVHENLANAQASILAALSDAEVETMQATQTNQELVSQLLHLTSQQSSWRDEVDDDSLRSQIEEVEKEGKKARAQRDRIKEVVSAVIVGSGVDWARDERLRQLVLDELS
ncbi:hypothetical protein VTN49DRAFT_5326 [Thermomyces lanuginosus]|uniref:uncharacterized protein n=1 Tax=Thermomyces lanuginosus TaxID=5541 RepID=UPI0037446BC6